MQAPSREASPHRTATPTVDPRPLDANADLLAIIRAQAEQVQRLGEMQTQAMQVVALFQSQGEQQFQAIQAVAALPGKKRVLSLEKPVVFSPVIDAKEAECWLNALRSYVEEGEQDSIRRAKIALSFLPADLADIARRDGISEQPFDGATGFVVWFSDRYLNQLGDVEMQARLQIHPHFSGMQKDETVTTHWLRLQDLATRQCVRRFGSGLFHLWPAAPFARFAPEGEQDP
jgi:hypothetical protein